MVVGVDEVGRGCLAGPVCVAAVASGIIHPSVDDSKNLSASRREELALDIRQTAQAVGLGWASSCYIDEHGIVPALKLAAERALAAVTASLGPAGLILLDGQHNYLRDSRVVTLVDGDAYVPLISAASIVAKVARDSLMRLYGFRYAGYGFERHFGYGTPEHLAAIERFGPSLIHRRSFGRLKGLA